MFTTSIRWRLQLWLAFLLVCLLSGFIVAVYQLQRVQQLNQIDEELELRVAALSSAVRGGPPPDGGMKRPLFRGRPGGGGFDDGPGRPPPPDWAEPLPPSLDGRDPRFRRREFRVSSEISSLFDEARTNAFYFTTWLRDGTLLKRSANTPGDVPLPARLPGNTRTHTRLRDNLREAFHFTELGDCVLAGCSITEHLNAMRRLKIWLLAAGGTVLSFGLGGGWWLTSRAIRPVEEISAAASRISAGNLSERIAGADNDNELGRLANVLNSTFTRLETAFSQQKQFTADASHELRTPLAVIISEAQTALARNRSAAEYRETVEACLETAQQMRRLTESLLELARFDADQESIERSRVDLSAIARSNIERVRPLAEQRGLQIHMDLGPAEAFGNADRLGQIVTNLLSNAIHYNRPNGDIRVRIRMDNKDAVMTVADTGVGIEQGDLPHIFERFYRADKSRSRAEGRNGLGLAICKAIVDAEGGSIEVSSVFGEGSTFTLRLPRGTPG